MHPQHTHTHTQAWQGFGPQSRIKSRIQKHTTECFDFCTRQYQPADLTVYTKFLGRFQLSLVLTCCVILRRSNMKLRSTGQSKNTGFQVLEPLIIYLPERSRQTFYRLQKKALFKFHNFQQIMSRYILVEMFNITIKCALLMCINILWVEAGVRTGPGICAVWLVV